MSETIECELGPNLRKWLLSLPEVAAYCGNRIVDTIPEECREGFIWYSMQDAEDSDSLCEGFDEFDYLLEIIGPVRELTETRRLKRVITNACLNYERGTPFGADDYWVQSLEVIKLGDSYVPTAIQYLDGIAFTAMAIRITP
jgi:hypothetical protein